VAYIDIEAPLAGSTLAPDFTANGTYEDDAGGTVVPTCVLNDSDGNLFATGAVAPTMPTWTATFTNVSEAIGLSLLAELPGLSEDDEHSNIMVELSDAKLVIDRIPPPGPGAPLAGVAGGAAAAALPVFNLNVTGKYDRGVAIYLLAMTYTNSDRIESVVGAGPATLNAGTKTWTATVHIQPVVGATGRLVVQAVMLNRNGKIMRSTIRKQAKA